jgi:hypothetical protein
MNSHSDIMYSTIVTLEALWKMNPNKSLMDIIITAAAMANNPPASISSCDDKTLLEGLHNLMENKYKR